MRRSASEVPPVLSPYGPGWARPDGLVGLFRILRRPGAPEDPPRVAGGHLQERGERLGLVSHGRPGITEASDPFRHRGK